MEILIGLAVLAAVGGGVALLKKKKRRPFPGPEPFSVPPEPEPQPEPENVKPQTVRYTSFQGDEYNLRAIYGPTTRLLVPAANAECGFIRDYIEKGHKHYRDATRMNNGEVTIAVVDDGKTCGAGCGYLGAPGIEIMRSYWNDMIAQAKQGRAVQIPLYELGRNYFTLFDKCNFGGLATGFAIYHRMRIAKTLNMADFGGVPWDQFDARVRGLIDKYLADDGLTYSNTFAIDKGIPGDLGGADLVASLLLRLDDLFDTSQVWSRAHRLPKGGNEVHKFVSVFPADARRWLIDKIGFPG